MKKRLEESKHLRSELCSEITRGEGQESAGECLTGEAGALAYSRDDTGGWLLTAGAEEGGGGRPGPGETCALTRAEHGCPCLLLSATQRVLQL